MPARRRAKKNGRPLSTNGKVTVKAGALAMHETPITLLNDIAEKRIDPTVLTADQRRACLVVMANGHQTSSELAAIFGVGPSCIRMDMKKIREETGREVGSWTLEEALGDLAHAHEKYAAQAYKQGDIGLAWTIKRDFVKILKDLGVIEGASQGDSLTVTIEGLGRGYERARKVLGRVLDPVLTGEEGPVIEGELVDRPGNGKNGGSSSLPLSRRHREGDTPPKLQGEGSGMEHSGEEGES